MLEGLHLAPPQGNALVLERATVLVRDCLVEATSLAAQLADSVLELDRCEFVPRVESGQISGGIRAARLSMVVARESRLVSGSGVLFGARITFLEERRIVPSFDLRLNTTAGNYDVTLAVTGEPGDTETVLTSDPSLPEPDIMALLVTGRTLDEMRGEEGDIAK